MSVSIQFRPCEAQCIFFLFAWMINDEGKSKQASIQELQGNAFRPLDHIKQIESDGLLTIVFNAFAVLEGTGITGRFMLFTEQGLTEPED